MFRYLNSKTVREVLVQALLDAPMFPIRWRWNATRSLALPRQRNGRKVPAPCNAWNQRTCSRPFSRTNWPAWKISWATARFPDHPLVRQTIEDCLTEAMDIDGLEALLRRIEKGEVECVARDLPEPSPLATKFSTRARTRSWTTHRWKSGAYAGGRLPQKAFPR